MSNSQSKYQLAKALEKLIVVRQDVHAKQSDSGRYRKVDEQLTTDVIKQHLDGNETVGSYQFKDDELVKWLCFDLDINKQVITHITENDQLSSDQIFNRFKSLLIAQAKQIQTRAKHYGINLIPEFSGNKGIHLWGFCDGFIDARQIRIAMKGIMKEVDMLSEDFHIDLFPAQDSANGKFGNFVKLPCGIHKKTNNRCSLLEDDYTMPEYSYEYQLGLLYDTAMGDNLITVELIESLQEEFELDEISVDEHKEQLEITEETLADLSVSDSQVDRVFSNCDTFSGMVETAKETGYLTHAQRLTLAFSLNKLGKPGRENLDSILSMCKDYNPDITDGIIEGIKKKGYKPFGCKSLLQPHPHHNEMPVCDKGDLCSKVRAIRGFSPNSFSFIPKSKTALQIDLDADKLKLQKEKLNQVQQIVSDNNLNLAWQRVINSLQNEVWYDVEEVDRYERFLNLNLSLLSMKLEQLVGKEIMFNDYELVNVRKFKDSDPSKDTYRPISIMQLEDYIIAQAIMNVVSPIFDNEDVFHKNSYGNRIVKEYKSSPRNIRYWEKQWSKYSAKISKSILQYPGHQFLKIDLKQYYEKIPHDNLIKLFSDDIYGVESEVQIWLNSLITNFKYFGKESKQTSGISQGPEFSHILANIYLNQFDHWIDNKYGNDIITHYRYVDDIYILISDGVDSNILRSEVESYLENDLGLQLNKDKTKSGYNFSDGFEMLDDLNKVKYRIGQDIKRLVESEGEPTEEEVQHIECLIKSMIAFESDADVDEILPHLNFASRSLFKLGIDTTLIKNTLVEQLNNWNPSTFNLKFLLKLLIDIYSTRPSDDIVKFFKEIDSYRKLLTLELIREINSYQGFDKDESFKNFALHILGDYKNDSHHLVRGTSIILLSQFEKYIDENDWASLINNESTSDFEKRSLVSHLNGYSDAIYSTYFEQYFKNTSGGIPAGITTILNLPNERFTSYSTALSHTSDIIESDEWIWQSDNLLSAVYLLFANLRLLGNKDLQSKNTSMRIMGNLLNNVPNQVALNLSRYLSRYIPDFIQSDNWDSNYYLNLYDPGQLKAFPQILQDAIHELLISTPAGITDDSPDIDKRIALFTQNFNDGIMLDLLHRVKANELLEEGFFPSFIKTKEIIENEDRRVQSFKDIESGEILIHERFPLLSVVTRSSIENENQLLEYLESFKDGDYSPVVNAEVSDISGNLFVSILYKISPEDQLIADAPYEIDERQNFNILEWIESKLTPYIYHRSEGNINLPHIHPYSVVNNSSRTDFSILSIGSMFDHNVYYLSGVNEIGLFSQDFSGSSMYFNLGFLSFELLTGNNPITAWKNAEIRALKNEDKKYISNDDALDHTSYFYRDWWLKTLCNSVVDFRRTYNPSKESDLLIEKMFKRYEKTLKATEEVYQLLIIVDEKDKSIIDYLAYLDVSTHDLDDAFWKIRYRDVIPSFLNTFIDFLSKQDIKWLSSSHHIDLNKFKLNLATCEYIQLADEFENFLDRSHKIYSSRLHDTYFYSSLLYYQAVKNEIYCLLISLLNNAGMRFTDEDQIEKAKQLIFNATEDNIDVDFEDSVSSYFRDSFKPKSVVSALFTLFGSEKNSFEKFFANDISTIAGLLFYLNGKVKFVLKVDEDQTVNIIKESLGIDSGRLKSIVGNIFKLNEKIHKVRNHPSDVSESEYQKIIELVKLIFAVSTKLNPAVITNGYQEGITNPKDENIKVVVDGTDINVSMDMIAFPSGKYETLYAGEVGVGKIDGEVCFINPPSKQVRKALNKIDNFTTTEETALEVIEESNEANLRSLLKEDFMNIKVRKRIREVMGEDKKIIVQKADQIINVDGHGTVNTGPVVQNIQHVNEEREVQAESSEIQTVEVDENRCSHKTYFELNNKQVALVVEGAGYNPTLGDNESKIYQYLRALAPYSKCGCPNKDCEFNEVSASMEYKTDEEALKRVRGNITKIRTHKKRKIRKTLSDMNLGITPEELFITPESEHGTGGYRLHEDFCIMDLTEKKVPDEE